MTNGSRRGEERERRERLSHEEDLQRQEDKESKESKERRSEDLKESWRRNHPSEQEEGGKGRPGRSRR
jgi:hypothetical protein